MSDSRCRSPRRAPGRSADAKSGAVGAPWDRQSAVCLRAWPVPGKPELVVCLRFAGQHACDLYRRPPAMRGLAKRCVSGAAGRSTARPASRNAERRSTTTERSLVDDHRMGLVSTKIAEPCSRFAVMLCEWFIFVGSPQRCAPRKRRRSRRSSWTTTPSWTIPTLRRIAVPRARGESG